MSEFVIVLFTLFLVQYTFAQCIGSRIDELASISNIPAEYLALGNYGAMDFLSSPLLEALRRNILSTSTLPVSSAPEATCANIFDSAYPYSVDALSLEVPYSINTCPASFEAPYVINKPYVFTESPFTNLRPLSIEFPIISNHLRSSPYEFNYLAFEAPYGLSATAALPYVPDILLDNSVLANSFNYEDVYVSNIPNYISPSISTPLNTCAAQALATDVFSTPSALSEVLSRISTPYRNIKCLGGIGPASLAASRGGGLLVTSSSTSRPTGISILSENTFQGSLSVAGKLPFLGTVSLGDTLPSFGYGTVNYNCGSGNVAMLSENTPDMPNGWYPRL